MATARWSETGRRSVIFATSLERAGKLHQSDYLVLLCFIRTVTKTHIPKRHHDFENPIEGKMFDNTNQRIYGESNE